MGRRSGRPPRTRTYHDPRDRTSELEPFLSPEAVFSDPFEIVTNPDLAIGEKRAILARWLARTCAAGAAFGLKWMPRASSELVQFDDVMDALRALEQENPAWARPGVSKAVPGKPQKVAGTVH